jgi:hypothetical protein
MQRKSPAPPKAAPANGGPFPWRGTFFADHPIRGPVITIAICIGVLAVEGTGVLQHAIYGPDPRNMWVEAVNMGFSVVGMLALLCAILTGVLLLINLGEMGVRRARYQPRQCPGCGAREAGYSARFAHQPIADTGWEHVTCPQCSRVWEARV